MRKDAIILRNYIQKESNLSLTKLRVQILAKSFQFQGDYLYISSKKKKTQDNCHA